MNYTYNDELYHFGIQGMKWGVRRYQNEDGTLTEEGRLHYGKMAKKLSNLEDRADFYKRKMGQRVQSKVAKLEAKAEKYRVKADKAGRSAARAFLPETGSEAFRKMTKFNAKAEKAERKAEKLIAKYESNKLKADNKVSKLAESIQKQFANVKLSEITDFKNYPNYETVANVSERAGVQSREMAYIKESNAKYRKEEKAAVAKIEKKKPSQLTADDRQYLDSYITRIDELYGHSTEVTEADFNKAQELDKKYLAPYREKLLKQNGYI